VILAMAWQAASAGAAEDRALIGQLDREVIALQQRVKVLEGRLGDCSDGGPPDPFYSELVQVFSGQPIGVARVGRRLQIVVQADLLFGAGTLTVRDEGQFVLDLVSTALKLHTDWQVQVIGYTDDDPPPAALRKLAPTNWELSVLRAAVLTRELAEGYGVSPHRFTVSGRGDRSPLASNDTPEGRAQNRRMVFELTPGDSR
jgi:chemotaxis protein MotB